MDINLVLKVLNYDVFENSGIEEKNVKKKREKCTQFSLSSWCFSLLPYCKAFDAAVIFNQDVLFKPPRPCRGPRRSPLNFLPYAANGVWWEWMQAACSLACWFVIALKLPKNSIAFRHFSFFFAFALDFDLSINVIIIRLDHHMSGL